MAMNAGTLTGAELVSSDLNRKLWFKSPTYDLIFFHLSGLACLLLLIPYGLSGSSVIFPIYNFYLIFFGLPHNYLTWATLFPTQSRKTFRMEPIFITLAVCLAICALIPFSGGSNLYDWILSFIAYYSFWHAYRQHHGICKVYDAMQAKRTGDATIFADRKALNLFFGFAAMGVLVWAFTQGRIYYLLSLDDRHELIHPEIPWNVYRVYVAFTAALGVYGVKRAIWDRWRAGKLVPWPQFALMIIAILTYVVPYFFIPLEAMPLAVAIGTIYHNVQYFGFVWMFERERSAELAQAVGAANLDLPQRLALQASWTRYFGLAMLYSIVVCAVYLAAPKLVGIAFIYFIGISHYIVDGFIWRRDTNSLLSKVVGRLAEGRA